MIGQRLRIARTAAGLSLRELESKLEGRVTPQALSKYERDEMMPSSPVLMSLARVLDVSEEYLLGEEDLALDGVEFRKKADMSAREEAQVEARVVQLLERYITVEEILNLPIEWDEPRGAPYPVMQNVGEAERAAGILREHWGLGLDPIPDFVELLEGRGIKVLSIEAEKVDGLTARVRRKKGTSLPVIVINQRDWSERKRFNLAHELGHLVLDVDTSIDCEKAAHRFAGAFLMPAESMWSEVGKHRTHISLLELLRLKEIFGASCQAITYRCKDLGIFAQPLYDELFLLFKEKGWRTKPYEEAGALSPEKECPKRLERLCYRALAEGAISEAKAAELLGISSRELNRRLDEPERVAAPR
jgi:Zn-dependent peptidase ImmA (M78 family)/DNA-binding XRE family transcriptional regulator